jgi:predicted outer membrane repeat protein
MKHTITVTGMQSVDRPDGGQDLVPVVVLNQRKCTFREVSAEERLQGGAIYATATHVAELWWEKGVNTTMTATVADPWTQTTRTFELSEVTNVGEGGRDLRLVMVERVS